MNTLDEIIKQNSDPKLLRAEILKNFEENISAIKNESIFLVKDVPSTKACMNMFFALLENVNQNFHNIYNQITTVDENVKGLAKHLKDLYTNFENNINNLNKSYLQADLYFSVIKNKTQNEHVSTISNHLQNTVECYRTLLNSYLKEGKQLSKENFEKEMFGNKNISFLENTDKMIVK